MRAFWCIPMVLLMACKGGEPSSPKVFYVNSYHQGYKSSDDIQAGIEQIFEGESIDLKVAYMDTKRQAADAIPQISSAIWSELQAFEPDLVIASDDNAVKHVVVPYLKDQADLPVLFCGVNWTSDAYGLPMPHIRGMLEVLPIEQSLDTLSNYFPDLSSVAVLSENSTSERSNQVIFSELFQRRGLDAEFRLVDDFQSWQEQFRLLNNSVDAIFLPTNGSIGDWDDERAGAFVEQEIRVPVFTCDDFMMAYAAFGLTKVAQEQGEWVAARALEVLRGRDVSTVPVTTNSQYEAWVNRPLLAALDWELSPELSAIVKEWK